MNNRINIFSPWMVNLLHWGLIIVLLLTFPTTLWPLTSRFWISISVWTIGFTIASFFCGWNKPSLKQEPRAFTFNSTMYNILLVLSILLTPVYLVKAYHLILDYGLDNVMYTARMVALDEDTHFGTVAYCVIINQVLFVTTLLAGKQIVWWKHVLVALLYFLCGAVIMEKGTFIFMAIVAVMIYYERGQLPLKYITLIGLLMLASAFIFTIARSDDSDSLKDQSAFNDFFETYLLAGTTAYCYMPEEASHQFGVNTFSQFYLIANKLHLGSFEEKDKLQEFINVPVLTNTYTVFQPFYLDFGQLGVLIFAIIYGIIIGLTYKYSRLGNPFAAIFYGYLVAMLCLQFHQEEIFTSFIRTLQYAFFAVLLTLPSRLRVNSKTDENINKDE